MSGPCQDLIPSLIKASRPSPDTFSLRWLLSTSRRTAFSPFRVAPFGVLKKIRCPPLPGVGHLRNRKQPLDFMPITGVDAEHMSDSEIVIGSLDDPDLISGTHISLDDDS